MTEMKVFGKWTTEDVKIEDLSIANHVMLQTKMIPMTFGRHQKHTFEKEETPIVERLVNKVMRSGQGKRKLSGKYIRGRNGCGKKLQAMRIVEGAFDEIEKKVKVNPLQLLIKAIENSAPREDITRIKRGGVSYTQAVDVAPLKRIDESLKNLALAAFSQSFQSKMQASVALANEIILAAKEDNASFAVKRRNEVERIAASSR